MRRVVIVNDKMQQGYRYELSASVGRDFEPQFRPDLTPKLKCSNLACSAAANTSPIAGTNIPRTGSLCYAPSSRPPAATAP